MSVTESAAAAPLGASESGKLHRRALGVPDLVFFIVAASAPLTAVWRWARSCPTRSASTSRRIRT